jgi:hypothetical protein
MYPAYLKIWLINISLAVFIVFFGMMSFDVWSKGDETVPEILSGKNPEKSLPGKRIIERAMPPESTYGIVAEKNLFSASRSEFVPEKQKQGPLKISEKMVILYGVVVMGDRKKALISNPEAGPDAGKKPAAKDKWVAVGDTIGTFSVTEIRKDRIILADGANTHEILLYDKNKPARQTIAAEASAAPTVVETGRAAVPAAAKSDTKSVTEPSASRIAEEKNAPAAEYKIVNTPFGPTKQRIK